MSVQQDNFAGTDQNFCKHYDCQFFESLDVLNNRVNKTQCLRCGCSDWKGSKVLSRQLSCVKRRPHSSPGATVSCAKPFCCVFRDIRDRTQCFWCKQETSGRKNFLWRGFQNFQRKSQIHFWRGDLFASLKGSLLPQNLTLSSDVTWRWTRPGTAADLRDPPLRSQLLPACTSGLPASSLSYILTIQKLDCGIFHLNNIASRNVSTYMCLSFPLKDKESEQDPRYFVVPADVSSSLRLGRPLSTPIKLPVATISGKNVFWFRPQLFLIPFFVVFHWLVAWRTSTFLLSTGRMFSKEKSVSTKGERDIILGILSNRRRQSKNPEDTIEFKNLINHKDAWQIDGFEENNAEEMKATASWRWASKRHPRTDSDSRKHVTRGSRAKSLLRAALVSRSALESKKQREWRAAINPSEKGGPACSLGATNLKFVSGEVSAETKNTVLPKAPPSSPESASENSNKSHENKETQANCGDETGKDENCEAEVPPEIRKMPKVCLKVFIPIWSSRRPLILWRTWHAEAVHICGTRLFSHRKIFQVWPGTLSPLWHILVSTALSSLLWGLSTHPTLNRWNCKTFHLCSSPTGCYFISSKQNKPWSLKSVSWHK